MKKIRLFFEIEKKNIIKNVSFGSYMENKEADISFWVSMHRGAGWKIKYLGYKEVK